MSDNRKPMRPHDALGMDVTLDRQVLKQDEWARDMLREIGYVLTKATSQAHGGESMKYLGSIALHFCRSEGDLVTGKYSIDTSMQFETGDTNMAIVNAGLSNLITEFKRRQGHEHKTTDAKDRRGQGDV